MKMIVGLGNPGIEYEKTRHNVGFMVVERVAELQKGEWERKGKFEVEVCNLGEIFLIKPMTFMNDSGRAVQKVMHFYKCGLEDLVVIHDDLDIQLGDFKIQKDKGPKIHNGVNNIEQILGSKEFLRVRVGIDNRVVREETGKDYVLGEFSNEEKPILGDVIKEVVKKITDGAV